MIDFLSAIDPTIKNVISDQIKIAVKNAESGFRDHEADEDVISGDLGGQLRTAVKGRIGNTSWETRSFKLGGRGENAPEKIFGADGVFEIKVYDDVTGELIATKGLPYQAKKNSSSQGLLKQVEKMCSMDCSSIVIDYGPEGFTGIKEKDIIEAAGKIKGVQDAKKKSLADMLSSDFLNCNIGKQKISYNRDVKRIVSLSDENEPIVIPMTTNFLTQIILVKNIDYDFEDIRQKVFYYSLLRRDKFNRFGF